MIGTEGCSDAFRNATRATSPKLVTAENLGKKTEHLLIWHYSCSSALGGC